MGHYKSNLRDLEFNLSRFSGLATASVKGHLPRWMRTPHMMSCAKLSA